MVLGIIAALAITAFMIYPKVSSSNSAKTEASNINTIKAAVKSLYSSSPDYAGLTTEVAIKSKVFPDTMVNADGTAALNTFKGTVTIAPFRFSTIYAENSSFRITYSSVPQEECVKIISAVASNFFHITVDGRIMKIPESGIAGKIDLDISKLTTACAAGNTTIVLSSF